jgi:hypothetical protein
LDALVHARQRMKRARQVHDMVYGPTDENTSERG